MLYHSYKVEYLFKQVMLEALAEQVTALKQQKADTTKLHTNYLALSEEVASLEKSMDELRIVLRNKQDAYYTLETV